jgi:hypothetical protein
MNEGNHEERIATLEKQMAGQLKINMMLKNILTNSHQQDTLIIKALIHSHDEYITLSKIILSNPTFGTPEVREKCFAGLANHEKEWDECVLPFLRRTLLPPLSAQDSFEPPPPA